MALISQSNSASTPPQPQKTDSPLEYHSSDNTLSSDVNFTFLRAVIADHSERQEIPGDCSVGHIHYLRQLHCVYQETDAEYIEIGRYQAQLLRYLEDHRFKHIFVEGLVHTWTLSNEDHRRSCSVYHKNLIKPERLRQLIGYGDDFIDEVRTFFPGDCDIRQLTDDQLLCLGNLGAYFIYGCRNPDVTMHRCIDSEKDRQLVKLQQKIEKTSPLGNNHPRHRLLCLPFRENYAMLEIASHLKNNPGDAVILIFGMDHDMVEARDHQMQPPPWMTKVYFPEPHRNWRREKGLDKGDVS